MQFISGFKFLAWPYAVCILAPAIFHVTIVKGAFVLLTSELSGKVSFWTLSSSSLLSILVLTCSVFIIFRAFSQLFVSSAPSLCHSFEVDWNVWIWFCVAPKVSLSTGCGFRGAQLFFVTSPFWRVYGTLSMYNVSFLIWAFTPGGTCVLR